MSSKTAAVDLTGDDEDDDIPPASGLSSKKRVPSPNGAPPPPSPSKKARIQGFAPAPAPAARVAPPPPPPPAPKPAKKGAPHALLWICTHGKGRGKNWKASALKVLGVYASKEAAVAKRDQVMAKHEALRQCYGHGDICVGDNWDDEMDLVVRPCEEVQI